MPQFLVRGGRALQGEVQVSGSKNAALPILAASLLADSTVTLHNVPDISDVHAFLRILSSLGADVSFDQGTVRIDAVRATAGAVDPHLVKHMRASILLLGPLLGRYGEARLAFPGGCVLGKRSVYAHVHALGALGADLHESTEEIHLTMSSDVAKRSERVTLSEASVTATENAVMLAVTLPQRTEIRWAAMEPHVQDLCRFLVAMGAQIEGVGSPTLVVHGGRALHGAEYRITPDYLEAGTLVLAAALTRGDVTVKDAPVDHLDSFWQKLEETGVRLEFGAKDGTEIVRVLPRGPETILRAPEKVQTSVFPGFPTDLQAPFAVLLTQCEGVSKLHETLFEGRLNYLTELERMGARVRLLNPHQAEITGSTPLKAVPIVSQDIRAGAAMVLAALIADGETLISDINYIDRGYEGLDVKLQALGAEIKRV